MRFSTGSRGRVRRVACARRPGAHPGQPCGGGGVTQAAGSAAIMIIIARQYFSLSEVNVTVTVSEELTCIVKFTIMTQSHGHNTSQSLCRRMQLAVRVTVSACSARPSETADWAAGDWWPQSDKRREAIVVPEQSWLLKLRRTPAFQLEVFVSKP